MLLYVAPCLIGDPARGIAEFRSALAHLSDRIALAVREVTSVGEDLRIVARVTHAGRLMFTGIVQAIGRIADVEARGDGLRIAVDIGVRDIADVAVGDSVAVNGCCLTVVEINGSTLDFDVSAETLRCTTGLDAVGDVNLEMALRATDRLGGHLVAGHVDGVGTVMQLRRVAKAAAVFARDRGARRSRAIHRREGLDRGARRQPDGERRRAARGSTST